MAVRKKIRQCTEYKNDVTLEVYIVPVYHTTCLLNNRDPKTENKRILKYIVFENYMYMGILISEQYYDRASIKNSSSYDMVFNATSTILQLYRCG